MERKRAIRLAEQWSEGAVVTLREGEVTEYHKLCLAALREQDATDINVGNKWISVDERLPEVLDLYLVVVKQKYSWEKTYRISTDCASYQPFGVDGYIDGCWDTCNDWDEGEDYIHVTHWMHLPEPPKEGAE